MWRYVVAVLRVIDVRKWFIPTLTEFQNQTSKDRPAIPSRIRAADFSEPPDYLPS
jgi:hypothetical protein